MSTSGAVKVSIDVQVGGAPRASFGIPLVLQYHTNWPERIRYYTDLADMVADGFATSDLAYKAVAAILSQSQVVDRVGVGRLESSVVMEYTATVNAPVVEGRTYTVTMNDVDYSYVALPADTPALVANALVGLLNGIVGKNFTATDNTDGTFDVTGDATGDMFCFAAKLPSFAIKNNTPDGATSLVDELTAIQVENDEWYAIIPTIASTPRVLAIAGFAQTACKTQIASSSDTDMLAAPTVPAASDTASQLLDLSRDRTMMSHHDNDCQYLSGSIAGRGLPQDVGAINWAWQGSLSGVSTPAYSGTQIANADLKRLNLYREDCGGPAFFYGYTSAANFFYDLTRSKDWLVENIKKDVCDLLVRNQKIPFTDQGIGLIKGTVRGRLIDAVGAGILAADPEPVVTAPLAADVLPSDKAARCLNDVLFTATLAGAINKVCVEGTVTL